MVGDQSAHHGVDVDHVRDLGPDHLGERLVADRPHMLGQHIRRGHEFRGDAVPCQTGLDERGQLVAGEGVQLAAGAVVVGLAVLRGPVSAAPVNHSRASSSSTRSAGSSTLRVNCSVSSP